MFSLETKFELKYLEQFNFVVIEMSVMSFTIAT